MWRLKDDGFHLALSSRRRRRRYDQTMGRVIVVVYLVRRIHVDSDS